MFLPNWHLCSPVGLWFVARFSHEGGGGPDVMNPILPTIRSKSFCRTIATSRRVATGTRLELALPHARQHESPEGARPGCIRTRELHADASELARLITKLGRSTDFQRSLKSFPLFQIASSFLGFEKKAARPNNDSIALAVCDSSCPLQSSAA